MDMNISDVIQQIAGRVDQRASVLSDELAHLEKLLEKIPEKVDRNTSSVASIENRLSRLEDKLDRLEREQNSLQNAWGKPLLTSLLGALAFTILFALLINAAPSFFPTVTISNNVMEK